ISWWKLSLLGATGFSIYMIKRRVAGRMCPSNALMVGKTIIITGANSGIGEATALELAKRQARVILACRDEDSANATVRYIRKKTAAGQLVVRRLDLASLASVKKFADDISKDEEHIDVLINNAGVLQRPFSKTEDGFETQMGVNHLGHFYLTNLLLPKLKQSAPSRVVVVSSGLHKLGKIEFDNFNSEKQYDRRAGYANSKLANNMFARELSSRLEGTGVCAYCLHPGMVFTNIGRHVMPSLLFKFLLYPLACLLLKSPYAGCQTVLYCAVAKELEGVTGHYYGNCEEEEWTQVSLDDVVSKKLWSVSEELTGLK
ncbi:Retinol dehydrogenase 14, partial [Lamellibrachia satsuma]